jgi:putative oxidoreductase
MIDSLMKNTVAPLVLRLCLAAVFIYHGMDLVSKSWGTGMQADLPVAAKVAVSWGQLLGGIAMLLGLLTRLAAIGLGVIMVGAVAIVHWRFGFNLGNPEGPGYEYNFVLIGICLVLMLTGGGTLAADRWVRLRPKRQ